MKPSEQLKIELHTFIDKMDDFQVRLVWSFIKTLFGTQD